MAAEGHRCEECGRPFATDRGLTQHLRQAHPQRMAEDRVGPSRNKYWSQEELSVMAELELDLVATVHPSRMVRTLAENMPDRGIESIKRARTRDPYREALWRAREEREALEQDRGRPPEPILPDSVGALDVALVRGAADVVASTGELHLKLVEAAREAAGGADPEPWLLEWHSGISSGEPVGYRRRGGPVTGRRDGANRYRRLQRLWRTDRPALAEEVLGTAGGRVRHAVCGFI